MDAMMTHGDAAVWGVGRFVFAVLLILAIGLLVKFTLFRNSQ